MGPRSSNPKPTEGVGDRPTLAMIARQLGVSAMTVSNAYNRPDQLSPALRERILQTAADLGYGGPDALARGLRRGSAGALGVLYDTWPSYVFEDPSATAFLRGLSQTTGQTFMGLMLISRPWPATDRGLDTAAVDGFVAYSLTDNSPQLTEAIARRPTVIVDQPVLKGVPWVGIDDTAAAAAAAEHLLSLGHTRIAILTFALALDGQEGPVGPKRRRSATFAVSRARLDGYRTALISAGLDWDAIPIYECGVPARMPNAVAALLQRDPRPTAVLAMSDTLALTTLRVAAESGLTVPDELSVVGFDDVPDARSHALTTIHQPHDEKGRHAGQLLLGLLDCDRATRVAPPTVTLPAELMVRRSTARPPRS
jgi:DNA-binding LacI/PurR family transcriptional regulator